MDELLTYIVQSLVNNPDDVKVEVDSSGGQVNLLLTVNPEDMGLVIGKGGQTIKAIRKLLITKAIVENVRVNLQLVEPEGYVRPHTEVSEKSSDSTQGKSDSGESEPVTSSEEETEAAEEESTATDTEAPAEDQPQEETPAEPVKEAAADTEDSPKE